MKSYFYSIILVAAVVLQSCVPPPPDAESDSTESAESTKAVKNGPVKTYRKDGSVLQVITYKDNKKDGLAQKFYADGTLKQEAVYKNNCKHGVAKAYYEDGIINKETPYNNCKKDGIAKKYYPDGTLAWEIPWKQDMLGTGLKEFTKSGKLKEKDVPEIVFEPLNQIRDNGYLYLRVKLSTGSKAVDFFEGNLDEGRYMGSGMVPITTIDGVAELPFNVSKAGSIQKKISIIAKAKTYLGNYHILQKTYNLNVSK